MLESLSSVRYIQKDAYGSESFWAAVGGTIVAEASNTHPAGHLWIRVAASPFTTQHSEIEEEFIDRGFEDVQGNEIAALNPSQEADKVDQIVKTCCAHSSSADSEDSDPMDFDNKVLETLAHLAWPRSYSSYHRQDFTHTAFI